ncbi:MAG: hypothetical protein AMJ53_09865 [Gammaproteobacteria bacterium SG8_11]|nr:MAG: hypothetical protein AMJ53_09865 [Gammaproteobacteria bacterium SG8_11]
MTSKQDWLEFLRSEGALIEQDKVSGFNNHPDEMLAMQNHTIMASLDEHAVISVDGEDNMDFLQNQFSNDVRLVNETHSQLSAYCSPKGRVLSLFRIIKQDRTYFLLLPQERLQSTLNRLKMFVLRSKVMLEDASGRIGVLGIGGNGSTELLSRLSSNLPQTSDDSVYVQALSIVKLMGDPSRYLIVGGYDQLRAVWNQCKPQATPVSGQVWAYWNIQAGLPEVFEVNSDEFVPQMLNLHSLNAINFKKGCYPGQEVVARMHYLGKQKRRMYLAHVDTDTAPQAGDNVYSGSTASAEDRGQSVGKIVTTTPAPAGGYDVLVVMQIASVETGDAIITPQNAPLNFKELPYFVEVEGKK